MTEKRPSPSGIGKKKITKPPLTEAEKKKKKVHNSYLKNTSLQDKNHREFFARPAKICTLCGYPMDYNGHVPTEREAKWSTHDPCREKAHSMLDRNSGIARDRKQDARYKK